MRVFIFGAQETGKTALLKQLTNQEATHAPSSSYKTTIGPDFQCINGMNVWDSPGTNGPNKNFIVPYIHGVDVGIYCINLSKVINDTVLEQMRKDISLFKLMNKNAKLILVGTFSDQALEENTVELLHNKLNEFGFMDVLTVTTDEAHGTQSLLMRLKHDFKHYKEAKDQELIEPHSSAKQLNKLEEVRNGLSANADLCRALDKLNNQVIRLGLNAEEINFLAAEVNSLFIKIGNSLMLDKTNAYNDFLTNCDAKFTDKYHGLKAVVKTFATVVLVTALAAGLFFGLGVAFGAWAGASTFFAAFVEGTTGTAVFAAGTTATNLASVTYFANRFFQKPVNNAANEFIENVKNADIEELSSNGII
ncbi:MAG: hypothetical protein LEGION0403_FIIPPAGN_01128 [Legionella sp.]|uniref:GTPase domain-containing protein n=1 Tax=Legionella sp. TaxID=459 RepID=UPI003D12D60D